MSKSYTIESLPDYEGKQVLKDALGKGLEYFNSNSSNIMPNVNDIILVGLSMIIHEIQGKTNE